MRMTGLPLGQGLEVEVGFFEKVTLRLDLSSEYDSPGKSWVY